MVKTNNNSPRGIHVSPGVYSKETDLSYAAKSLGITKLAAVGETLTGPAFQVMTVENWREYQSLFGGVSTEKFRGSQYPKYELPYIAKEYLSESNNLQVVRVLGLSGVNAGPAFIISAYSNVDGKTYTKDNPMVVAVLRSRGEHKKAAFVMSKEPEVGICEDVYEYDGIEYYAKDVFITPSTSLTASDECNPGFIKSDGSFAVNVNNYGTFTLKVEITGDKENPVYKNYPVSLNPTDKNYIVKVLGVNPEIGESELYVEELYDIALKHLIEIDEINELGKVDGDTNEMKLTTYRPIRYIPNHKDVESILTFDETLLKRKNVGERYLADKNLSVNNSTYGNEKGAPIKVHVFRNNTWVEENCVAGHIYTVTAITEASGQRKYYYTEIEGNEEIVKPFALSKELTKKDGDTKSYLTKSEYDELVKELEKENKKINDVYNEVDINTPRKESYRGVYMGKDDENNATYNYEIYGPDSYTPIYEEVVYVVNEHTLYAYSDADEDIIAITLDMNNYKEAYRYASTPWIISEIKGSAEHIELNKLFRFHMISDGNTSNTMVKVSIENVDPEDGTFDVKIRDFNDVDGSQIVYERYQGCNLVPGSKRYLGLLIGTTDGKYSVKSNYVTVEINENDKTQTSVPSGFLGYPLRNYEGGISIDSNKKLQKPEFQYNLNVDEDIKITKQYFGISDLVGIDSDILSYKGVEAYNDVPEGLSPCFHLDSRIFNGKPNKDGKQFEMGYVIDETGKSKEVELTQLVTVDGVSGYTWATVGKGNMTAAGVEPRIGTEAQMLDTIYEDKRYRKFTVVFYGGWDGWDYYRTSRSIGDEFQYSKYRGSLNFNSGYGSSLDILKNSEAFDIEGKAITSDFYAFLAGIRQFANPKTTDANILVTPGIDYVNNNALVQETIEMVETERADAAYIVTTPDKPFGASDSPLEMYSAEDAVWNLEDADIDSNYTATYYPWVKFFDKENNQYIFLPPTKDVVRNMAYTDNVAYPWFAAAGWNRGTINGEEPKKKLKIAEQDTLYDGRINFVNTFAEEGMKIWGDKNLQINDSVMNRLSKRRLLLRIRKLCSIAGIGLLFDPNDNTTKKAFESAITPILNSILSNRGISDWRLEIDDSEEARDRLELPAKIFLKPIGALEYITLDFIINSQGTVWDGV